MTDMAASNATADPAVGASAVGGVAAALAELRARAIHDPARAHDCAWDWMLELGARRELGDLRALLALGTGRESSTARPKAPTSRSRPSG